MSYEVRFRGYDAQAILVSNERGEKLKELWFAGKTTTPIEIDGNMYLTGDIKRILHVPDPPKPLPAQQRLAADSKTKCKGQYSIHLEIMQIAHEAHNRKTAENPDARSWGQLLRDRKWKEQMRQELHKQPGVLWCDNHTNECACDPEKPGKGMDAVREIFGGGSIVNA